MVVVDSQVFSFENGFSPIVIMIALIVCLVLVFVIIKAIRKRRSKKKEILALNQIQDESEKVMDRLKLIINRDYRAIEAERKNTYLRNISENARKEAELEEQKRLQKENLEISDSLKAVDQTGINEIKKELVGLDYHKYLALPEALRNVLNDGTLVVVNDSKMYYFDTKDITVAYPDLELTVNDVDIMVPVTGHEDKDGKVTFEPLVKILS